MSRRRAGVLLCLAGVLAACGSAPSGQSAATPGVSPEAGRTGSGTASAQDLRSAGLPSCPESREVSPRPDGLPDLTLSCLGEGPDVTLSGLRGTPLVLNVWASWCPPCAHEMPLLEKVRGETEGKVAFLGVDLLDARGAALDAADGFGMTFPSVQDPDGESRTALKVPGPPVTLFVAADGRVVHREVGEITSADTLRGLVREHLGVPS